MFTGRVPFHGESIMATLLQQLQEPPPLDGEADGPGCLPASCRCCAARWPSGASDRYESAALLADALRAARAVAGGRVVRRGPGRSVGRTAAHRLARGAAVRHGSDLQHRRPRAGAELRRDSRIAISVDLVLVRVGPGGVPGADERTLADNIGRRGRARADGGRPRRGGRHRAHRRAGRRFQTTAAVRHVSVGADGIRRLGVEFLDRSAPDRLVPNPEAASAAQAPAAARGEPPP